MGDVEKEIEGLYSKSAKRIFRYLRDPEFEDIMVGVSFFEIYCEKAFDLLNYR